MKATITWNSGVKQTLHDIERVIEYQLDADDRLMFCTPSDSDDPWSSASLDQIKSVEIRKE